MIEPTTGARNSPPVAMNRGATPARLHAAIITSGSTGLRWLAARISGPRRSSSGTAPETRSRHTNGATTRDRRNNARHIHGTRHVASLKPP
jgi:hypothetical protein